MSKLEINVGKEKIQEEMLRKNDFYGAAIMATGGGKTLGMLRCLDEIFTADKNVSSILYTCDNRKLLTVDFPAEIEKWGYDRFTPMMDMKCYQSAYKLKDENYDILLADEGDFGLTPQYIKLFKNNEFKYLIFVSATLSPEKMKLLHKLKIPIIYQKELSELEDEGVLNKSKYFYVNFMLNEAENKEYLYYNKNISRVLNDSGFNDPEMELLTRNRKLFLNSLKSSREVCKQLLDVVEGRKIVFSELTNQIDRICEYTYHGKNEGEENLRLFHEGEIDTLGVVGKVDRGVNIHRIENVILESCSSSKTKIVQKLGRGKRLGIDEILNVYMQIPYFKNWKDEIRPTIVLTWLEKALKDFNIPEIEVF